MAENDETGNATVEEKPLPDRISLIAAQWVSLSALRNDDNFCLQEIGKYQAEIRAYQERMQGNQGTRAEILKDIEVAESLPITALKNYQFTGKELVKV